MFSQRNYWITSKYEGSGCQGCDGATNHEVEDAGFVKEGAHLAFPYAKIED